MWWPFKYWSVGAINIFLFFLLFCCCYCKYIFGVFFSTDCLLCAIKDNLCSICPRPSSMCRSSSRIWSLFEPQNTIAFVTCKCWGQIESKVTINNFCSTTGYWLSLNGEKEKRKVAGNRSTNINDMFCLYTIRIRMMVISTKYSIISILQNI